jgi:hypothetical protein
MVIDVSFASSKQSLQEIFAAVLGFPGYYGMNWDAFGIASEMSNSQRCLSTLCSKACRFRTRSFPRRSSGDVQPPGVMNMRTRGETRCTA